MLEKIRVTVTIFFVTGLTYWVVGLLFLLAERLFSKQLLHLKIQKKSEPF